MNLIVFYLLLLFDGVTYSHCISSKSIENKRWHEGLVVEVKRNGSTDTINLKKIIEGTDKTTYLLDLNEDTINYKSFENRVILLDFWFLKCKPCIAEMPNLKRISKTFENEKFELITFSCNSATEINSKLLSKTNLNFTIILNVSLSKLGSYPQKFLINKNSKLIDFKYGGATNVKSNFEKETKYKKLIQKLLYN